MTRHTERALLLSLLVLTLIVGITALVLLHRNRGVYLDQEQHLEEALKEKIQEACTNPASQQLKEMQRCEEALAGFEEEKALWKGWITDSQAHSEEVSEQLATIRQGQDQTQGSLTSLDSDLTIARRNLEDLQRITGEHGQWLQTVQESLRLPPCPEGGSTPCPPPTLAHVALATKDRLDALDSFVTTEWDETEDESIAYQLLHHLKSQEERFLQRTNDLTQTLGYFEEQLRELETGLEERDRLLTVLDQGVTAHPEVQPQGEGHFVVLTEPPTAGYPCRKLELVAQLVDSKNPGDGEAVSPVKVSAEVCRNLTDLSYQCGRLAGENNTLTLWVPYEEKRVGDRILCQAEVQLPPALLKELDDRAHSVQLRIGVHLQSTGGTVPINRS